MSRSQNSREKIVAIIRERITSGEYPPGRRIPSQLELAHELRVANRTVTLAIAVLREAGYVRTVPRRGMYACLPDRRRP